MVSDITYEIVTKGNGRFPAKFNVGGINNIQRGNSTSFVFELGGLSEDKTYTSDTTIEEGDFVAYDNVTVNSGVTLTVEGTLRCDNLDIQGTVTKTATGEINILDGGFETISSLREWAGKYAMSEMLDGTNKYRDQIPSAENIDSLVIGVEPSDELKEKDIIGIWGIVDTINDERPVTLNRNQYRFEVTVLGEYGDYTDHTDLENELRL